MSQIKDKKDKKDKRQYITCMYATCCVDSYCSYKHNPFYPIELRKKVLEMMPYDIYSELPVLPKKTSYCIYGDVCHNSNCQYAHVNSPETRKEIRKAIAPIIIMAVNTKQYSSV